MIPLLIEATIKCGSCNEYAKVKLVPTKEGHLIAKEGCITLPKGWTFEKDYGDYDNDNAVKAECAECREYYEED